MLPEANPEFIKWICRGKTKVWPKKEANRTWEVWNLAWMNCGGGVIDVDAATIFPKYYWGYIDRGVKSYLIRYEDSKSDKYVDRDVFIAAIYDQVLPENFILRGGGDGDYDMELDLIHFETTITKLVNDQWNSKTYVPTDGN